MEILQIKRDDAIKAYHNSDQKGKTLLSDLFGKDLLPAIERIKTFEDACKAAGVDPEEFFEDHRGLPIDVLAYLQLRIIAQALNEGWKADWFDGNQKKFYAWFDTFGGSFRFFVVGYYYQRSSVSSRLCFRSSQVAEYAAKQFKDLYLQYLNG